MAVTAFALPHNRDNHLYYLMSPTGDATANITINASTTNLNLTVCIVTTHSAGGTNGIGGIVTSDTPRIHAGPCELTEHRGWRKSAGRVNY